MPLILYNKTGNWVNQRKKTRKKRKKKGRGIKKKPKRFRDRVLPDTNIWSERIKGKKIETEIITLTDRFETLIYSGYVDEELSHVKDEDENKSLFEEFRKKMRSRLKRAHGSAEKYSGMIAGKDKYILRDAEELKADVIVTNDGDFDEINEEITPTVMKPKSFLKYLKERNKYHKK